MNVQNMFIAVLLLYMPVALAQEPIQITVTSEKEVTRITEQGEVEVATVPAETVLPGDTLVFVIDVANISDQPATDIVVTDPISSGITYQENSFFSSAQFAALQITFSVDGGTSYLSRDQLQIQDDSGQLVAAGPEHINAIRWQFSEPIPPGEAVQVGFRATVN